MLCLLLINFIEVIEISGMLVDHFQKKEQVERLSFLISKFIIMIDPFQ